MTNAATPAATPDATRGVEVAFHGVRGSCACHGRGTLRYGGNTSSVSLRAAGAPPLLVDLGTGVRYALDGGDEPRAHVGACLLTHLHWDHTQGLPFLSALRHPGTVLDVYAPRPEEGVSLAEAFAAKIRPPQFPIHLREFPGSLHFHEVGDDDFETHGWRVSSRLVPHRGPTLGFRVQRAGTSVSYMSDHAQPAGDFSLSRGARQLAQGTDLLIHDAQFTPAEWAEKVDWGHSTIEYAMWVAETTSTRRLALFHHDPGRSDDDLDAILGRLAVVARTRGFEVFAAAEESCVRVASAAAARA
jgi:ribonuclease BN (tRNA processing enzyme)